MDWEREAKKQAAIAGEYRIYVTAQLESVRDSMKNTMKQLQEETNTDTQMKLYIKLMVLQKQAAGLESIIDTMDRKAQG